MNLTKRTCLYCAGHWYEYAGSYGHHVREHRHQRAMEARHAEQARQRRATVKRRHYHVEDTDGHLTHPFRSMRMASHEAYNMVQHARRTGLYRRWSIERHDPEAGYRRWIGSTSATGFAGTVFHDYITVQPCTDDCLEVVNV